MKILFVHEVSWQKKVTYEIHDFPELLARKGHDVSFFEFDEDDGKPELVNSGLKNYLFSKRGSVSRTYQDSTIFLISPKRFLPGTLGRLLAIFVHPFLIFGHLVKNRPDVVVLYSVPTNGWQTLLLSKALKIPVLFRAIDVSHQIRETPFQGLIKIVERFIYRNVHSVSTHNHALANYVYQLSRGRSMPAVILPGVDLERFHHREKPTALMRKYQLNNDDKVLLFMGTLFRFSGLQELIRTFKDHLIDHPRTKIVIIGNGEEYRNLTELTLSFNLQRQVIFTGRIDYSELPDHLNLGDVSVLPFTDNSVTQLAMPGKVLQYLSSGLPCVSFPLDGLQSIFNLNSGVVYVSSFSEMYFECCQLLLNDEIRLDLGNQGRMTVERLCNWDEQVLQFESLLNIARI